MPPDTGERAAHQHADDPVRAAGLVWADPREPGLRRVKAPGGFGYRDAEGGKVSDARTLERIRGLVIPPAWTDVWISPSPRGHIQATGRDARGRLQYRYHPDWRRLRDSGKYDRLIGFG